MNEDGSRSMCPLSHENKKPRSSTRGTVLCTTHEKWLWDALNSLGSLDAELTELTEGKTARHDTAPLTGSSETPMAIDIRIADLRYGWIDSEGMPHNGVHGALVSWVKLFAEERSVSYPADTLHALSAFLRLHHTWAVGQGWVDDYAGEILELGKKAHQLLNPSGRRRFTHRLMRCIEEVEGERCIGNMWALLTPEDPYAEVSSTMICDLCAHEVPSGEWLTYGRRVRSAAG